MKKRLCMLALVMMCFTFTAFSAGAAKAAEVDVLINKLLEKNVITQDEAVQLMADMNKEGARENEAIKTVVAEAAIEEGKKNKQVLPKWVENLTLSGDVRIRYQTEDTDNDTDPSRTRTRMRLRSGVDAKVNSNWKAGFGFASGGDDPRSTNQTFENEFQHPDLRIDYAYATYTTDKKLFSVTAGKMKNPLWAVKDLMWDTDINPEGISASFNFKASDKLAFFVTPAYFILEEEKTKDDPAMMVIQPGLSWKINDTMNLKFAGAYYNFTNVKGSDMSAFSSKTNSSTKTTVHQGEWNEKTTYSWANDYDSIALDGEFGVKFGNVVETASIFGNYVKSEADSDNTGWLAGVKFGNEKVSEFGKWQVIYNYRNVEKDAWADWMPDSDFYSGKTGVKGSELEVVLGLGKNVTFGIDYYMAEPINNPSNKDQSLFQADLVVKF